MAERGGWRKGSVKHTARFPFHSCGCVHFNSEDLFGLLYVLSSLNFTVAAEKGLIPVITLFTTFTREDLLNLKPLAQD